LNGPETSSKSLGKSELSPKRKCIGPFSHTLKMYGTLFVRHQISNHSRTKKTTENSWLNGPETSPKSLGKSELSPKRKCMALFLHAIRFLTTQGLKKLQKILG
jgi:hypothetical protein